MPRRENCDTRQDRAIPDRSCLDRIPDPVSPTTEPIPSRLSHNGIGRHHKVMALHIAELWRYPVKSLAGERLSATVIRPEGIPGDRTVRVRGPEGVRTARRQYRLLGLRGTLGSDSRPRINGHAWDSPAALALVKAAAGADAWLEAYDGVDRFDILPLLVATDGAVAALAPTFAVSGPTSSSVVSMDSPSATGKVPSFTSAT